MWAYVEFLLPLRAVKTEFSSCTSTGLIRAEHQTELETLSKYRKTVRCELYLGKSDTMCVSKG